MFGTLPRWPKIFRGRIADCRGSRADRGRVEAAAELRGLDAREQQAERKRDTRRKILLGAMLLDRVARGEVTETVVKADMERFLEREQDRALFGLSKRPSKKES